MRSPDSREFSSVPFKQSGSFNRYIKSLPEGNSWETIWLSLTGWWLSHPSEKDERQLGWLFPSHMGKSVSYVPVTTKQSCLHPIKPPFSYGFPMVSPWPKHVPKHQPVSHDLVTRPCASHVAPGTDASHPSAVVSPAPAVTGNGNHTYHNGDWGMVTMTVLYLHHWPLLSTNG